MKNNFSDSDSIFNTKTITDEKKAQIRKFKQRNPKAQFSLNRFFMALLDIILSVKVRFPEMQIWLDLVKMKNEKMETSKKI